MRKSRKKNDDARICIKGGKQNRMDKKTLKTFIITLTCIAAVIAMILLSGLQGGNAGSGT